MAKLTEKTFATAVTLNSLIHIVNTGDTTQSAYGSSYKASLNQLVPLFGSNPDVTVTGGTYNPSTGIVTFFNNTGGTFNVSGFVTGFTDSYVSGGTYVAGTATFTNTTGGTFTVPGFYTGSSEFYVSDGSLTSNRIVNMDGYVLALSGGSSNLFFGLIGTGDKSIQWSQTGPLNWDLINSSSTNDLQIDRYSSGGGYLDTPLFIEFSSGNIGVGITSPTAKFHINNTTSGNTFLAEDSTNPDSTPFIIDASGNTGIGTTTPTTKLDINGGTRHRGNVTMDPTTSINWADTSAVFPTSLNNRILWSLNNDSAQIYAFQPETDNIDFVFKMTDNAFTSVDNFVFWIDDFSGETFDRYPLELNGIGAIVNPVRRYALSASTSGAGTTNFYVLESGATSLSQSVLFANTSTGNVGIGTNAPSEKLDVNGKTKTTTLQITSGATNGYVLTSDASGNASWQASSGGGGVSIDPYNNVGSTGTTLTWNVSGLSTNFQATLTANTTLNLTNVRNGDYGTIIVTQDAVGSRTITFGTVNGAGTTHRVTNGGFGSPILTSNANAIDILTFTYNGSTMFWTVGNDYT